MERGEGGRGERGRKGRGDRGKGEKKRLNNLVLPVLNTHYSRTWVETEGKGEGGNDHMYLNLYPGVLHPLLPLHLTAHNHIIMTE